MKQPTHRRLRGLITSVVCVVLVSGLWEVPRSSAQAPMTDGTDAAVPPLGDDDSNIAQIRNAYPEVQSAVTLFCRATWKAPNCR